MGCPSSREGQVQQPRGLEAEAEGLVKELEHWELAQLPRDLEPGPEWLLLGPEGLLQHMDRTARAEVQGQFCWRLRCRAEVQPEKADRTVRAEIQVQRERQPRSALDEVEGPEVQQAVPAREAAELAQVDGARGAASCACTGGC